LNKIKPHYQRDDTPEEDFSDLTDPPEVVSDLRPLVTSPGDGQPMLPPIERTLVDVPGEISVPVG